MLTTSPHCDYVQERWRRIDSRKPILVHAEQSAADWMKPASVATARASSAVLRELMIHTESA